MPKALKLAALVATCVAAAQAVAQTCPTGTLSPSNGSNIVYDAGVPLNFQIAVAGGGITTYYWQLAGGNVPIGLTWNGGNAQYGSFTGSPVNGSGPYSVTINAYAAGGTTTCVGTATYYLYGACPTIGLSPPTWSDAGAIDGVPFTFTINADGGTKSTYFWQLTNGTLPPGLSWTGGNRVDGVVSGTPSTGGGPWNVNFVAYNESGSDCIGTAWYRFWVDCPAIAVFPDAGSDIRTYRGVPFSLDITADGGTRANYFWQVASGSLPPGLSFSGGVAVSARVSGTPTTTGGPWNYSLNVYNGSGTSCVVPTNYHFYVDEPPDGGFPDGGADAGSNDAGTDGGSDAGSNDAGSSDAGSNDGGSNDGGSSDGGCSSLGLACGAGCCTGLSCEAALCCVPTGGSCTGPSDCCAGTGAAVCQFGKCAQLPADGGTCLALGQACTTRTECCTVETRDGKVSCDSEATRPDLVRCCVPAGSETGDEALCCSAKGTWDASKLGYVCDAIPTSSGCGCSSTDAALSVLVALAMLLRLGAVRRRRA